MLSNEQKHADSERVHGPHKSDHADGVKVTLATSALILYIATQASSYEAQLVKKKNSSWSKWPINFPAFSCMRRGL